MLSQLWDHAKTAYAGKPEKFVDSFIEQADNIPFQEITKKCTTGELAGVSIFSLIAGTGGDAFDVVWAQYCKEITFQSLMEEGGIGEYEGFSPWWAVSESTSLRDDKPFLTVWEKFQTQLKMEHLIYGPKQGPREGYTVLFLLTAGALNDTTAPLLSVWNKFGDRIPLEYFLMRSQDQKYQNASPLWVLTAAVFKKINSKDIADIAIRKFMVQTVERLTINDKEALDFGPPGQPTLYEMLKLLVSPLTIKNSLFNTTQKPRF